MSIHELWLFATISQTVGAVWALLVIFIWRVLESVPRNRKLAVIFIVLNVMAASAIIASISGLASQSIGTSVAFVASMVFALGFIASVAAYYISLSLILYTQAR